MEEKLNELYRQCINELKSIDINIEDSSKVGNIDIKLSNRETKRYGCCKQESPDEKFRVVEKRRLSQNNKI